MVIFTVWNLSVACHRGSLSFFPDGAKDVKLHQLPLIPLAHNRRETNRIQRRSNRRAILTGLFGLLCLFVDPGCAKEHEDGERAKGLTEKRTTSVNKTGSNEEPANAPKNDQEAITIAKEHLRRLGYLATDHTIDFGVTKVNHVWCVGIPRVPSRPGGQTVVVLSESGKVICVIRGQ